MVCGLGPAGRALAHRCLARGMAVTVVDPHPDRRWRATYAAWADELPAWLEPAAIAATVAEPRAYGRREHRLTRPYVVLDTARLQTGLDLTGATVLAARAEAIGRYEVRLDTGPVLRAERVVDARGLPRRAGAPEQTAFGLVLPRSAQTDAAFFMDWRADNGTDPREPRSFLYSVPLGADTVLAEETCLVGAPAIEPAELARRLRHRLRVRGIEIRGDERVERVRFRMTGGAPGAGTFGAAGGYLHPATGYSVAAALSAADDIAAGGSGWTLPARAVHRLRRAGLRALLSLPPAGLPDFFDAFFDLDIELQRAYLSDREDLAGMLGAMSRLFAALPGSARTRLAAATLHFPAPSHTGSASVIME